MTSPPSPLNRRRRRIAVVAILALGLWCWLWPRVDQRFVGTWVVTSKHHNFPFGGEEMFVFSSDGFGLPNPLQDHLGRFRWIHEGNKIHLECYQDDGPGSYVRAKLATFPMLRRWLTNTPPVNVDVEFTVFGVTEQTLRMKDTTPGMFPPEPWLPPRPPDDACLEFRRVQ
jgi:hypothetical protein